MGAPKAIRIGDFEVESHYLRFVESELKRHPYRKRRLKELEDDLIRATSEEDNTGMPRGSNVSNPTLVKALALMKDDQRAHLQMQVRRVEEVYKGLTELQQRIVDLLYFGNRYTYRGVMEQLHVSRRQMYYHRNKALLDMAFAIVGDHVAKTVL